MVPYALSPTAVRLAWDAVAPAFEALERAAPNALVVRIA
jgi:hypothetical protein